MREASKRSSVFYDRGLRARFRHWRFNRRMNGILDAASWPQDRTVFAGNVALTEVVYAPGEHSLAYSRDAVRDALVALWTDRRSDKHAELYAEALQALENGSTTPPEAATSQ